MSTLTCGAAIDSDEAAFNEAAGRSLPMPALRLVAEFAPLAESFRDAESRYRGELSEPPQHVRVTHTSRRLLKFDDLIAVANRHPRFGAPWALRDDDGLVHAYQIGPVTWDATTGKEPQAELEKPRAREGLRWLRGAVEHWNAIALLLADLQRLHIPRAAREALERLEAKQESAR